MESLDRDVLEKMRQMGDPSMPDLVTELIDMYLEDAPGMIAEIHGGVRDSDAAAIQRAAHGLRGSCHNLGVRVLAELCKDLEHDARDRDLSRVADLVRRLDAEYARVVELLRAERRS